MKRKVLSLVLALALVLALLPTAALAADNDFTIKNGVLERYRGEGGVVVIPDGVTSIKANAFEYYESGITQVIVPEGVTEIGYYAFHEFPDLVSVSLPSTLRTIGWGAFSECPKLEEVDIPEGVTEIGQSFFNNCTSLKRVGIPSTVTKMESYVFSGCSSLTSVVLPGITTAPKNLFARCTGLEDVTFGEGTTTLESDLFYQCSNLKRVNLPSTLQSIKYDAFKDTAGFEIHFNGTRAQWNALDKMGVDYSWVTPFDYSKVTVYCTNGIAKVPGMDNFTRSRSYTAGQFTDVAATAWYAGEVKNAYELGLMNGSGPNAFNAGGYITLGETLALASRLHDIYSGGTGVFEQGTPWYNVYVVYALENHIIEPNVYGNMTAFASRAQFATILSKALPEDALPATNEVVRDVIPDVKTTDPCGPAVYALYRAGILTGSDAKGTFHPELAITRSEVAAIVSRMADKSLRKSFTLAIDSAPYSYLAGTLFRSVKRDYHSAEAQYGYVYAFENSDQDVCVMVLVGYKIISNYTEWRLYNITKGSTITDPSNYYKKLADRAYGTSKIHYLDLHGDVLVAQTKCLGAVQNILSGKGNSSTGAYVDAYTLSLGT